MPFTPSHAVVAIPLRRLGLPLGAVAVGSMVPDVAVFLPQVFDYGTTHSVRGVLTVDLLLGLALVVAWWAWLREPVVDLLPDPVRHRVVLRPLAWRSPAWWALVVAGVLAGAATHVGWDAFTHAGGWGARHLPALRQQVGPSAVTSWLQYASGVLGLVGIGLWWWSMLRSRAVDATEPRVRDRRPVLRGLPWLGFIAGVAVALVTLSADAAPLRVLVRTGTTGAVGGAVGVVAVAAWWSALERRLASAPATVRQPGHEE